MKTDDLIAALAADTGAVQPIAPQLMLRAGIALLVSAGIVLAILGIRPGLVAAITAPVTALKWLLPLALAGAGLVASLRLSRPTAAPRLTEAWLPGAVAALALVLLGTALTRIDTGARMAAVLGDSAGICLISVLAIAALPLGIALAVLRSGASPRPGLSGAMAGLAVGGASAAVYAMHCNEDAPTFFVTWYGLGIIVVTLAGWAIGRRTLRW